jgi:hypothetical protein
MRYAPERLEERLMDEPGDRRREARLPVPWHLTGAGLGLLRGFLVDLSSLGARIEHAEPLEDGLVCEVDLPPALGWGWISGRVVWTGPHESALTFEGNTRLSYHSGLAFDDIMPEQQMVLAVALEILQTGERPNRM